MIQNGDLIWSERRAAPAARFFVQILGEIKLYKSKQG